MRFSSLLGTVYAREEEEYVKVKLRAIKLAEPKCKRFQYIPAYKQLAFIVLKRQSGSATQAARRLVLKYQPMLPELTFNSGEKNIRSWAAATERYSSGWVTVLGRYKVLPEEVSVL